MTQEKFQEFKEFVNNNEGEAWEKAEANREKFESSYEELFANLEIESTEEAREKAFAVIEKTLNHLENVLDLENIEPGHGIGHLSRDYIYATILSNDKNIDPKQAYIGTIAGVLHDILGCNVVNRYDEGKRVVRHGEAGGLLFQEISKNIDVSEDEALLVYYAIAGHPHYLKTSTVKCADGKERETKPYMDIDEAGNPIMAMWLTRWSDRLDVNGPNFVGRHFLTLFEEHEDYGDKEGFYSIKFSDQVRPLLRNNDDIKADPHGKTMREHFNMFATSQNNNSEFGKFDDEAMIELRDFNKESLFKIIDAFELKNDFSKLEGGELLKQWTNWMINNVEPTLSGKNAIEKIMKDFAKLPEETKQIWYNVIKITLAEYDKWCQEMRRKIENLPEMPKSKLINMNVIADRKI